MAKTKISTEREVSDELRLIGQDLIAEMFPNLKNASIVYIMQTRINEDSGLAVAPRVAEKYGTVRAMSFLHRMLHHEDFWVVISGNWWARLDDHKKRGMLCRHLCSCDMHRGKPTIAKPDFVGYVVEVKHFGPWSEELTDAQSVLNPQLAMELLTEDNGDADADAEERAVDPETGEVLDSAAKADPFGDESEGEAEAGALGALAQSK